MINEWMLKILNYIKMYVDGSPIMYMYLIGLVFLCFRGKDKRRMIVYPSIILMVIIFNPWLYGYVWIKLIEYAFWRMLWMIPVLPVIGCAVVELAGVIKKEWMMYAITIAFMVVVYVTCGNIYKIDGTFKKTSNGYKLPQECVDIGHIILLNEEEPVVLAPKSVYSHLRQYDGEIGLVFGRDAEGYILPISDSELLELNTLIHEGTGDIDRFTQLIDNKGVNVVVLKQGHEFGNMENYGFDVIYEADSHMVYHRK